MKDRESYDNMMDTLKDMEDVLKYMESVIQNTNSFSEIFKSFIGIRVKEYISIQVPKFDIELFQSFKDVKRGIEEDYPDVAFTLILSNTNIESTIVVKICKDGFIYINSLNQTFGDKKNINTVEIKKIYKLLNNK